MLCLIDPVFQCVVSFFKIVVVFRSGEKTIVKVNMVSLLCLRKLNRRTDRNNKGGKCADDKNATKQGK